MRSSAFALLTALMPVLSVAETHGRVSVAAAAGGGYASDLYIGADTGGDALAQVAPSVKLDFSAIPALKLRGTADVSYGQYLGTGFTAFTQAAALAARAIDASHDRWELELTFAGDRASYSTGAPLDTTLAASPSVASTYALSATALARIRTRPVEWRAAGSWATRESVAALGGRIPERDFSAFGGFLFDATASWALSLTYKFMQSQSTRLDYQADSHALYLGNFVKLPTETVIDALVQGQISNYASATVEQFGRAVLSASHPLTDFLDVETAYAFSINRSNDPARRVATRHFVYAGLRVHAKALSW